MGKYEVHCISQEDNDQGGYWIKGETHSEQESHRNLANCQSLLMLLTAGIELPYNYITAAENRFQNFAEFNLSLMNCTDQHRCMHGVQGHKLLPVDSSSRQTYSVTSQLDLWQDWYCMSYVKSFSASDCFGNRMPGDKIIAPTMLIPATNFPQKRPKQDSPVPLGGEQPSSTQFDLILQELIVIKNSNTEIYNELKNIKPNIVDLNRRVGDSEARISSLENRTNQDRKDHEERPEELENRSQHNNLRIIGVPEGVEGSNTIDFIQIFLNRLKEKVKQKAKAIPNLTYEGNKTQFFDDFTRDLHRRRWAYNAMMQTLAAAKIKAYVCYPTKAVVFLHNSQQSFETPEATLQYLQRELPTLFPAPTTNPQITEPMEQLPTIRN
nr:PREDICTED: uncharacterized protein LOC106706606 [Latimeria chalumnae]|eukprot:XP_014353268.1 PREDICTED: uncharacterized protein LOC106706606 [Latimeria chalumnae]